MREDLRQLVGQTQAVDRLNVAREYLQARILASLQRVGAMPPLAFHGGTALRFLFALPRYSEALDFALERPGPTYDFQRFLGSVRSDLTREGYLEPGGLRRTAVPGHGGRGGLAGLREPGAPALSDPAGKPRCSQGEPSRNASVAGH